MMKRETVVRWAREARKFGYYPSNERERQLADSHLEALDEIENLRATLVEPCPCCPRYAERIKVDGVEMTGTGVPVAAIEEDFDARD